MPVFEKLAGEIISGPTGHLYFVHLLLPHSPFIYDSRYKIHNSIREWNQAAGLVASAEMRSERYQLYFGQISCTLSKLRHLFERLQQAGKFEDTTIIIHGDHGSRIVSRHPSSENKNQLSAEELVDGFSTLFAVKVPGQEPGYDSEMHSVEEIFEFAVQETVTLPKPSADHYVYLPDENNGWTKIQFPALPLHAD